MASRAKDGGNQKKLTGLGSLKIDCMRFILVNFFVAADEVNSDKQKHDSDYLSEAENVWSKAEFLIVNVVKRVDNESRSGPH